MAAYAALNCVMDILRQIQQHPRPPITIEKQQMESLCENISFLQDFLENYSHRYIGNGKEALMTQIANAAYGAEDVIDSYIVDQTLADPLKKNKKKRFLAEESSTSQSDSDATYGAEEVIEFESHSVDQILAEESSVYNLFCQDLQKIIEDMNLIKKEAIVVQEKMKGIDDDQLPRNIISMSANIIGSSLVTPPKRKHYTNTMVGFDDVLNDILDRLTGYPTNRLVLPIVGMGGIGKTTLARNVYDHRTIVEHFHIRIWVTITQDYRLRDILQEAISCLRIDEKKSISEDELGESSSEDELGDRLHKSLCGRTYLILLDDMWSIEAWEKLMFFFPDNNNGSRIMITTRLSNVSNHFRSHSFKLNFLGEDKSWDLFCKIVFPEDQYCPLELEEMGKKIASNCKGLPLSIVVIGGLLASSEKTQQHWEYIAENLNPILNLEDEMHCFNILYLSYNSLPLHLKPCFLYMGVFSEGSIISVPKLKRLWIAEGFLKQIAAKSLEEVAEEYLTDLIDRNLILVRKLGSSGKVKYCEIHDLLRDLCLREGEKDKFLCVRRENDSYNLDGIQSQRRISFHKSVSKKNYGDIVLPFVPSASLARSLTSDGGYYLNNVLSSNGIRLARVLNIGTTNPFSAKEIEDIFMLVNTRYLDFAIQLRSKMMWCFDDIQLGVPWNLQTLIITGRNDWQFRTDIPLPSTIWDMSQLRHLEIDGVSFPSLKAIDKGGFILRNLHTMKGVKNLLLTEEVIKRIPNIKKLKTTLVCFSVVKTRWYEYGLNLESLEIDGLRYRKQPPSRIKLLQNFALPHSLKKLSLHGTPFLWEDMRMIGSLPHLQVLKLNYDSFRGPEWNPVEGEFLHLKFLLIESCKELVDWNANRTHFPSLEQLVLRYLNNLKEIPLDIGHIRTLRSIELLKCSDSAIMSAKNLLDEQVAFGNEDLKVQVMSAKNLLDEQVAFGNEDLKVQVEAFMKLSVSPFDNWKGRFLFKE